MKKLKISDEISFPIDAVTQTLAAIGRKGAGKSYLATMIAEQMLDNGAQVIALDPVGIWWGLRVAADGRSKGKEIFVMGGEHGDVPLVPEAGARIARLLVEKNISAVLDVSHFRIGEHKRFAADFAEEFFHLKKTHKTPVHLFVEEAQKVIPQRVGPDEARMVGAFEQIVRIGRNYGIGATLITQRPQSVNKEVLSQVECLCVLQLTGPHERKALEEWVYEAGADRKLVGELPSLGQGEGYVWSPSWLRIYKRVHFAKKATFDASATPEVGKAVRAASISAVDVDLLRKDMAEVIEEAEKDDPVALRRRITQLEKFQPKDDKKQIEKAVMAAVAKREKELVKAAEKREAILLNEIASRDTRLAKIVKDAAPLPKPKLPDFPAADKPVVETRAVERPVSVTLHSPASNEAVLSGPQQRIINGIAWAKSIGIAQPEHPIVAFLSGYTNPKSTGYTNPRGELVSLGLISYPSPGKVDLTEAGEAYADTSDSPKDEEDLQERVLARLTGPQQRILRPLIEARGKSLDNDTLATAAGYSNPKSTGYTNPRGELRSYGLIEYPTSGTVAAAKLLFLE